MQQHILIIEDDHDTARFFKVVLDLVGVRCDVVHSAKDALAWLATSIPDTILLDMRLGLELSGQDILYQIRSNPRFDATKVVIITAYPGMADQVTSLADLILLKPVDVDHLKTLVERLGSIEVKPKRYLFLDPVTEVFNEEFLISRLDLAFERFRRREEFHFGLTAIGLEPVISTGVIVEDWVVPLLKQVADRLSKNLRPTDTISRVAGWKFVILHEELRESQDLQIIAYRIKEKLQAPYKIGENPIRLNVQIGAVAFHPSFAEPTRMIEAVEAALENETINVFSAT